MDSQPYDDKRGRAALWIVLAALVLRVVAALVHPVTDRVAYPDAGDYHDLGSALARGGEYRVPGGIAVRMPGYPALVAGVYAVAGERPLAVLMVQAAMGAGACWVVYLLARRVSERAGLLAAGLAAVDPLSIAASASLLSEGPYALALVVLVWAAVITWEFPRHLEGWLLIGLSGAAGVYLRASSLYLPAVIVAMLLARHTSWQSAWRGALAVGIVVLALWPWKQWISGQDPTRGLRGLTSLEGISLYEAVYEHATGGPMQGEILREMPPHVRAMGEAERDAYYRAEAWRALREHPGRVASLVPVKFARMWTPGLNAGELRDWRVETVLWAWHVPLFLLAILGACLRGAAWHVRAAALGAMIYFAALHLLFMGSVRYRVPLHPLVCMLAAIGAAAWLVPWLTARLRQPGAVSGV